MVSFECLVKIRWLNLPQKKPLPAFEINFIAGKGRERERENFSDHQALSLNPNV
jgi:hypothetical protein